MSNSSVRCVPDLTFGSLGRLGHAATCLNLSKERSRIACYPDIVVLNVRCFLCVPIGPVAIGYSRGQVNSEEPLLPLSIRPPEDRELVVEYEGRSS